MDRRKFLTLRTLSARVLTSAVLGLLVLVPIAEAETAPQIDWVKQFGTTNTDSATGFGTHALFESNQSQIVDGYAIGWTNGSLSGFTNQGGSDAFIRHYDRHGNILFQEQFGTSGNDKALGIHCRPDNTMCFVVGTTTGTFPGEVNAGGVDAFIRAYSANGEVIWTKQLGTDGTDVLLGVAFNGVGVSVGGYTTGSLPGFTNAGGEDALYAIVTNDGIVGPGQFGTTGDDRITAVSTSILNDGVILGGTTTGTFDGQTSSGGSDLFLKRTTPGFEVDSWMTQFGTSGNDTMNALSSNGSKITVAGETDGSLPDQPNAGGIDALVWRFDTDGHAIWAKIFGSTGTDRATSAGSGLQDHAYVAGTTDGTLPGETSAGNLDIFMKKMDANGASLWTKQTGTAGNDFIHGIGLAPSKYEDNSYFTLFAAGDTDGTFAGETQIGDTDAFTLKLQQDEDNDEIYNEVDILPGNPSDEFSDTITSGTIENRGSQNLSVINASNPDDGISITADPTSNPTDPAVINACNGATRVVLEPGDGMAVRCGSAIVKATHGSVDTTFVSSDGITANTDINAGNTIRFAVSSDEFTTPSTNIEPVALTIGATTHKLLPGTKIILAPLIKDSIMVKKEKNQNEGANPYLQVGDADGALSVVEFDLSQISLQQLKKATLLLSVTPSSPPKNWGRGGRIDVQKMRTDFVEGNGKNLGLASEDATLGTGEGITWNCAIDSDISNTSKECKERWKGGDKAPAPPTAPSFLMLNGYLGQASWNVTRDVRTGGTSWLIGKREEGKGGIARFFSKEGASDQGNLMPQLVLEYDN